MTEYYYETDSINLYCCNILAVTGIIENTYVYIICKVFRST